MTNGTIKLVVKYKIAQTNPFVSGPVTTSADFIYKVVPEKNNVNSLYSATPTELNFDLTGSNAVPLWATDVYIQVVFKGTLGTETNAVAVGFKDISEPTPMDMLNNMDKICINSNWYDSGSAAAIDLVDTNNNGQAEEHDIYGHNLTDIHMRILPYGIVQYASPSEYNFIVPSLQEGHFLRAAYFLSDYQYGFGDYSTVTAADTNDFGPHSYNRSLILSATAIKRQRDYTEDSSQCEGLPSCYVERTPDFVIRRGFTAWHGEIWDNIPYPSSGSSCQYDTL